MAIERPSLLVLVRHAESARNVAKKGNTFFLDDESRKAVQGVADQHVPITDEGRRQAERTGRALRAEFGVFDYVYHSGYRRTQETAEHLLAAYPPGEREAMRVRQHLFLRERDAGWTYDMTTAEAEAAFPWLQGYWDTFGRFFARPPGTPIAKVESAAAVIAEFSRYHINPSFDIIVDNPIETRQDVVDTLELLYRLARPFTLNIFSLRLIPNTVLETQMKEAGVDIERINSNYHVLRPTLANVTLYLLTMWRPPRPVFDRLLTRVRAYGEPQASHPILLQLIRIPWLVIQGLRHLRFADFSLITGSPGFWLWRLGIISTWLKLCGPRMRLEPKMTSLPHTGIHQNRVSSRP